MDSIIFDLDGTLWDSRKTVAAAWTKAVQASPYGQGEVTEEDLKQTMGLQVYDIAKKLFHYVEEEKQRQLMDECCTFDKQFLRESGGVLYDDLETVLTELSKRYKLLIVSNCEDGYIESFYAYHGLAHFFTDFENPGRTGLSKGENIRLVIERNNLRSPVYVGDTQGDRDAARFAGIRFVYAAYGFGDVDSYEEKINSLTDLLALYK